MIGNDLVDLEASALESNWRRKGWQTKVLTPGEQAVIRHSAAPETLVWLFWSMKEAAYKLCCRSLGSVPFVPAKFECAIASLASDVVGGLVHYGNVRCYTRSMLTESFIHTTAAFQNDLNKATVFLSGNGVARSCPGGSIFFKDANGLPYLVERSSGKVRCASCSHHGRFEAIAFW
jgi:phosphopantetheinyl transferase (holo-ACP synthase)